MRARALPAATRLARDLYKLGTSWELNEVIGLFYVIIRIDNLQSLRRSRVISGKTRHLHQG